MVSCRERSVVDDLFWGRFTRVQERFYWNGVHPHPAILCLPPSKSTEHHGQGMNFSSVQYFGCLGMGPPRISWCLTATNFNTVQWNWIKAHHGFSRNSSTSIFDLFLLFFCSWARMETLFLRNFCHDDSRSYRILICNVSHFRDCLLRMGPCKMEQAVKKQQRLQWSMYTALLCSLTA